MVVSTLELSQLICWMQALELVSIACNDAGGMWAAVLTFLPAQSCSQGCKARQHLVGLT